MMVCLVYSSSSCWTYPYNPLFWSRHESLFNAVNTAIQPNKNGLTNGATPARIIAPRNTEILLAGKRKGTVGVLAYCTLDPIRAKLDRDPAPWRINEIPYTRP